MSLTIWSWVFFTLYVLGMCALGMYGARKIKDADDYAVARQSYGPLPLGLAFAATGASGATFLGMPGLAYSSGISVLLYAFCYPLGMYIGVLICLKVVSESGNGFGSRSIPEYLGDRYRSERIRIIAALMSLILFFYLAGQLVAGLVIFKTMLGLSEGPALILTTLTLLTYVTLGGAHADILTDAFQGAVMLLISIGVIIMFVTGFGIEGGFMGMFERLRTLDPNTVRWLHPTSQIVGSPWAIVAIVIAHIPLGMLPHIGNKLWALKAGAPRHQFLLIAFVSSLLLPALSLGGLLARAHLGDDLLGGGANQAIPAMFITLFPAWLAALLGVSVLCAVMSTADGLVVSSAQVIANDLYRRTFAKRWAPELSDEQLDQRVLQISRWATGGVLLASALAAWALLEVNIALIVWMGIGGMTSAMAGPLIIGSLWPHVSERAALSGMLTGFLTFALLHTHSIPISWLQSQGSNPFACAAMASILGVFVTVMGSLPSPKK